MSMLVYPACWLRRSIVTSQHGLSLVDRHTKTVETATAQLHAQKQSLATKIQRQTSLIKQLETELKQVLASCQPGNSANTCSAVRSIEGKKHKQNNQLFDAPLCLAVDTHRAPADCVSIACNLSPNVSQLHDQLLKDGVTLIASLQASHFTQDTYAPSHKPSNA